MTQDNVVGLTANGRLTGLHAWMTPYVDQASRSSTRKFNKMEKLYGYAASNAASPAAAT